MTRRFSSMSKRLIGLSAAAVAFGLIPQGVNAAGTTDTWGGGTGTWSTGTWTPDNPPTSADNVTFSSGTGTVTVDGVESVSGITISTTTTGGYTLTPTVQATDTITVGTDGISVSGGKVSTISANLLGSNAPLTISGTSTRLNLLGANSFVGSISVSGTSDTLMVSTNGDAGFGDTSNSIEIDGGSSLTMGYTGNLSATRTLTLGTGLETINTNGTVSILGLVTGAGGIMLNSSSGGIVLASGNTYQGITDMNKFAVSISADSCLGTAPGSVVANAVEFTGTSGFGQTLNVTNSMVLNSNRGITVNTATLGGFINIASGQTLSYGGVITGAGNLTFGGVAGNTGTASLTGASTNTGKTTVSLGTLALGSGGSLSNTAVSVANTATFSAAAGTSIGTVVSGAATLSAASGSSIKLTDGTVGTFTINGAGSGNALTLSGATLAFDLGTAGADELVVNGGTAASVSGTNNVNVTVVSAIASGTYTVINDSGGGLTTADFTMGTISGLAGYSVTIDASSTVNNLVLNVTASAVPEPASLGLLGIGAAGLLARRRRSNAKA